MQCRRRLLVLTGLLAGLVLATPDTVHAQESGDGRTRTELVLNARSISIAYDPTLQAGDPSHQALLTGDATSAEVRLGRLTGHGALRIGPLGPEPGDPPRRASEHELWLTRDDTGWAFDARPIVDAPDDAAPDHEDAEPPGPARIPLAHLARPDEESETPLVAIIPSGDDTGEIALRWGRHSWSAGFTFVELATPERPERSSDVGPGTRLTRDSDLSARWRATRRNTRNETIVATPDGRTIQVWFQRELGTDHRDFAGLESTADGEIVLLSGAAALRLRTEVPLRAGDLPLPTGNLAPNFPGAYAMWLRAVGDGWALVFNNEPDSWGTQHDPAFDVGAIPLTHTHGGPTTERPLAVYLAPRSPDRVGLVIHWGQHTWTADFTLED